MAELTYSSFDLWIGPAAKGYLARGWDSHGREATADFRAPFSDTEIEDFWRRIRLTRFRARRHATGCDAGGRSRHLDLAPELGVAKRYGGSLFEALFHGTLLHCFGRSLDQAQRERAGLRIRLRLTDVPELANLPWEYLYDGSSDRFFALSVATPVVRYLELPEPLGLLTVQPPLKMLVMIASPGDYGKLDVEQEWWRLNEALGDLRQRGLVEVERLRGATLAALQRRLRRGEAHVFHFIGHGDFDSRSQKGTLIFEDESGRGLPVGAEDLGVAFYDHPPRLVVLNACEGAVASRRNPFAGVAQTLIRQGVPGVLAMQTEILDDFALTLAQEFYGALADGYSVDACLAEARKVLAGQQFAAWGTPVLYLRAPDGRILHLQERGAGGREDGAAKSGSTPTPTIEPAPAPVAPTSAAPGAATRVAWAAVAAFAVVLLLVLVYGRANKPSIEKRQPGSRPSEAEPPGETTTEITPPPMTEEDHASEGIEPEAIEPVGGGSDPMDEEPDPEGLVSASGSTPTFRPAPQPRRPISPSWPLGDGQRFVRQNERDGQRYAWIPKGSFRFGCSPGDDLCEDDEGSSDQEIKQGFWLGQTEVTVRAYKRFRDHPSKLPPAPSFNTNWEDGAQPMVNVSRTDAEEFCEWIGARLPTEIEWEYAARAGEPRALPSDVSKWAWFSGNSGGRANAVSQKKPNAFSLYDMLGNASEWVAAEPDQASRIGILRGGAWLHAEQFLRLSFRLTVAPDERNEMFGFRCLADPS